MEYKGADCARQSFSWCEVGREPVKAVVAATGSIANKADGFDDLRCAFSRYSNKNCKSHGLTPVLSGLLSRRLIVD